MAETARQLVAEGALVVLGGRRADRLDALVAELGTDNAVAVIMDVRSPADNARLVAAAVDRWGRLDSVVPNAGIGAYGGILDQTDEQLTAMMDTNFAGTMDRAGGAASNAGRGGGDVVIVSSVAGFRGGPDEAVYTGTKHTGGLRRFTGPRTTRAGRARHPAAHRHRHGVRRGEPAEQKTTPGSSST